MKKKVSECTTFGDLGQIELPQSVYTIGNPIGFEF